MSSTNSSDKLVLDAKLFEDYPLYRKLKVRLPKECPKITLPGIHSFCLVCNSENTFIGHLNLVGNKQKNQPPPPTHPDLIAGRPGVVQYRCASCSDYHQFFLLYFDEDLSYVMKIGQYPTWSISIDKNLSKILSEHEFTFRKGLICESQGYGIGAYAYYRRIIENIIDGLLNSIYDILEEDEKKVYEKALQEARKSIVAKEKIAIVKDLLPTTLRPDNVNPLGILHDTLSVGIHNETDEECLELAGHIREILIYLVDQINRVAQAKESSKHFKESMKKLLEKRNQKKIQKV